MGHQKLGILPRSKRWDQVVALIAEGRAVDEIAAATANAAEASIPDVSNDPAVRHGFWLLTQIPLAARDVDFPGALRNLGLDIADDPALEDIVAAASDAIDQAARRFDGRSDYGELAQMAFGEALYWVASREPEMLGENVDATRIALSRLARPIAFSELSRDFFSRLTRRHLAYYLSRELTNHVGPGQRFGGLRQYEAFDKALDLHCREASRIIGAFSAEWFSKHLFEGGIDRDKAGRFVHAAAKKMRDELRQRRRADA